jgi:dihydropteroate synthase
MLHPQQTLNLSGRLLTLDRPLVMGILNVTPDSFFDGGRYDQIEDALKQTDRMISEGADMIDIGGMSSRPGAQVISSDEELTRVLPIIKAIRAAHPQIALSVDTVYAATAKATVEAGADLINDISGGTIDQGMFQMVADLGVPYVLMHMQGRPETMQQRPDYEDVVQEVLDFFITQNTLLRKLGVKDLILDPGFGFGKSLDHNYKLLKKMHVFRMLDCPILAGISRKSMINKVLGTRPENALNGTTALHMVALQQGASILRVHDVREAVQVVKLWSQLQ